MVKVRLNIISCFSILLLVSACNKEKVKETSPIVISDTPSIALVNVKPATIQQFEGALTFTINYTDGDGDIGFEDADEKALEITDERAGLIHTYHVPPVAPLDTTITVTGTLVVELDNVILIDQDKTSEMAVFKVRLRDRAGNWSNTVTSNNIIVTK